MEKIGEDRGREGGGETGGGSAVGVEWWGDGSRACEGEKVGGRTILERWPTPSSRKSIRFFLRTSAFIKICACNSSMWPIAAAAALCLAPCSRYSASRWTRRIRSNSSFSCCACSIRVRVGVRVRGV